MKHLLSALLLAASLATAVHTPASAQSDILLRLRSGSPAGDRFRVDSAGSVVALTSIGIGIIPATGCGERMMWYSFKAAFRAGTTDDGGACNYWDDANVGFYSWAGGSYTIAAAYAAFAMGDQVTVTGVRAAGFGQQVTVTGSNGFATGYQSRCTQLACIALGNIANADGDAAVALGFRVTADADYSVAMGQRASTNGHAGAFVIADASTTDSLQASLNNQFSSRYAGGYRLFTNATMTTGMSMSAGGSSWNVISDRTRKENFATVDGEGVLAALRSVPVTSWQYRDEVDRSVRHVGPMAQDWQHAFGLSADETTINMSDLDGVNLAAVKALEQRTAAQQAQIQALRTELDGSRGETAALRTDVQSLRDANAAMEARLQRLEAAAARTP
jgi:trimeric autotransporter adhesin